MNGATKKERRSASLGKSCESKKGRILLLKKLELNLRMNPLQKKKDKKIIEGWRDDPRMVFLANPGRDLTSKERAEWERNIRKFQITY